MNSNTSIGSRSSHLNPLRWHDLLCPCGHELWKLPQPLWWQVCQVVSIRTWRWSQPVELFVAPTPISHHHKADAGSPNSNWIHAEYKNEIQNHRQWPRNHHSIKSYIFPVQPTLNSLSMHEPPAPIASLLTISSTFDSLFKVLFTFPSRYLFAIGLSLAIFSLGWDLPPA